MNYNKVRLIRTSTIPGSINTFCRGLLRELQEEEGYDLCVISSPGDALQEIAEREGVAVREVPMERHISLAKDLRSLWLMIRAS